MKVQSLNQYVRRFASASEAAISNSNNAKIDPFQEKISQTLSLIYARPRTNPTYDQGFDENANEFPSQQSSETSQYPRRLKYNLGPPTVKKFTKNRLHTLKERVTTLRQQIDEQVEKSQEEGQTGVDPNLAINRERLKSTLSELDTLQIHDEEDESYHSYNSSKPHRSTDYFLRKHLAAFNAQSALDTGERLELWSSLESNHRLPDIMTRRPSGKADALLVLNRQRQLPYARDVSRFERLKTLWTFSNSHGVSWDELDEEYIRWAQQGQERRRKWAEYAQRREGSSSHAGELVEQQKERQILSQAEEEPTEVALATMENAEVKRYLHRFKSAYLRWHRPGQLIRHLRDLVLTRMNHRELDERFQKNQ